MMKVFNLYSKYYDLLYKDKNYEKEVDYINSLLCSNTKTILELGCGTGKHARLLNRRGYQLHGIDFSEGMIEKAKTNDILCEVADVRSFRVDKIFDAILSLFHIASYQITNEDVLNYFRTANFHLSKGSRFIFDIWYKPAVLFQIPEKRTKIIENEELKIIRYCTPNHVPEQNIVEVKYIIEITDKKTNSIEIIEENHKMRYFDEQDIIDFAQKTGFEIVNKEEWLTKQEPSKNSWSVCFVVEKI